MKTRSRRQVLAALLGIAALAPASVLPQAAARPKRVVWLITGARPSQQVIAEDEKTSRAIWLELGFVLGRDVVVTHESPEDDARAESVVMELAARPPDLIMSRDVMNLMALKRHTRGIPVVFYNISEPIELGLVKSLARPGGDFTGVTNRNLELVGKRLELLKEFRPRARRVAILADSRYGPYGGRMRDIWKEACSRLDLEAVEIVDPFKMRDEELVRRLRDSKADGFLLPSAGATADRLVRVQNASGVPGFFQSQAAVKAGGLVSIGAQTGEGYRQAIGIAARIFRGESPADIPVEQLTRVHMAVNLATARALRIDVPATILARADEVIQ